MTRRTRPRIPLAPGQLVLDALVVYPDALRVVASGTGTALVLLPGGATPAPTPVIARRRAAA